MINGPTTPLKWQPNSLNFEPPTPPLSVRMLAGYDGAMPNRPRYGPAYVDRGFEFAGLDLDLPFSSLA